MEIKNGNISFNFSPETGQITIKNILDNVTVVSRGLFDIEGAISLTGADESLEYFTFAHKEKENPVQNYYMQKRENERLVDWNGKNRPENYSETISDIRDVFGEGNCLAVKFRFRELFEITQFICLYRDYNFITFQTQLKNLSDFPVRLREYHPLCGGVLYEGCSNIKDMKTLDGMSGNGHTHVNNGGSVQSSNNIILTFTHNDSRKSLVAGGLSYSDFAKYIAIDKKNAEEQQGVYAVDTEASKLTDRELFGRLDLMAFDPHGRVIRPGEEYINDDKFYLDIFTPDPFEAAEGYAEAVRLYNSVDLIPYPFPIINGWYLSTKEFGDGVFVNNTDGLLNEAKLADATGITEYTPIAVQLEPDKYFGNTEQGWWDEKHFRLYGHLSDDEEGLKSWTKKLKEYNCSAKIYLQTGMPSDDFVEAHPGYMIKGDIDLFYKRHIHELPYVRFDYTNNAFRRHMKKVWRELKGAGIAGVKFDYPETAWIKDREFSDKTATTASAYTQPFRLAKAGLGKNSFVNERNLGAHKTPCLDLTVGIADTQRIWNDSSSFDPYMITKAGLRWYKNRTLYHYDIEAKNFLDKNKNCLPIDVCRSIVTMSYVVSCRLLMANSFAKLSKECINVISKMYPPHAENRMFRPIDAFTSESAPFIYHYRVDEDTHQVALFNHTEERREISLALSAEKENLNQLRLDKDSLYYVYDFWGEKLLGLYGGGEVVARELDGAESCMLCIRKKAEQPQIIATNRHLMAGLVELSDVKTEKGVLSGNAQLVKNDNFALIVARNAHAIKNVSVSHGEYSVEECGNELVKINFKSKNSRPVKFKIYFQ